MHKLQALGYVKVKSLDTFLDKLRWSIYMSKDWLITKDIIDLDNPLIGIGRSPYIKSRDSRIFSLESGLGRPCVVRKLGKDVLGPEPSACKAEVQPIDMFFAENDSISKLTLSFK